jgi:hypothetical protein
MNHSLKTLSIALAFALSATGACAQSARPSSRDEVRMELAEAARAGTIVTGEAGLQMREMFPGHYPLRTGVPHKTREQVKAELAEAQRTGDIYSGGDSGLKLYELYPSRYPQRPVAMGKTRDQVRAELVEAQRSGDLVTGESGLKLNEMFPGSYSKTAVTMYANAPAGGASPVVH